MRKCVGACSRVWLGESEFPRRQRTTPAIVSTQGGQKRIHACAVPKAFLGRRVRSQAKAGKPSYVLSHALRKAHGTKVTISEISIVTSTHWKCNRRPQLFRRIEQASCSRDSVGFLKSLVNSKFSFLNRRVISSTSVERRFQQAQQKFSQPRKFSISSFANVVTAMRFSHTLLLLQVSTNLKVQNFCKTTVDENYHSVLNIFHCTGSTAGLEIPQGGARNL